MLVIADLEVNKTDLAIIEERELRQVHGGGLFSGVFGSGIGVSTIAPSYFSGGGRGLLNIFPNPALSPSSLVKTAGLKF